MHCHFRYLALLAVCCLMEMPLATVAGDETAAVLTEKIHPQPRAMMTHWLNAQTEAAAQRWADRYESLKTPEQIASYQQELSQRFVEELGGFPERTPLNPQVTGVIQREGYRVEKILFESQPRHYVSALCFIPDSPQWQAPYPGVLVVCGHSANGKALAGYQSATALLALNGMVGLIIDPICQGERYQHLDPDGKITVASSTQGHTLVGLGAILLGQNTARFEIWDGMRGIDYLQSREDVDPARIGCMGNSGGGTQTAYLMALDDRIQAASPSCYITSFSHLLGTIGPQDAEQNIHGQLAWGMDHADYLLMRAPVPINLCAATRDFFPIAGVWESYRRAKRLYTRLGFPERVALAEVDEQHGWHQPLRESATQWMSRWLAGRDVSIREPKIELLSDEEVLVTPAGQVQLLPEARSVFDLNLAEYERLAEQRIANWQDPAVALVKVAQRAGIRSWQDLAPPVSKKIGELTLDSLRVEQWILEPEPGILLPALLYRPAETPEKPRYIVYLHAAGKQARFREGDQEHSAESLAREGAIVLAIDLRGLGETAPGDGKWYHTRFGEDARQVTIAYLLGRSYVGLRAEDLLATLKWLRTPEGFGPDAQLELISVGEVGPPVLHAACLAPPELVSRVQLREMLQDWKTIVKADVSEDQVVNLVHGALRDYDLTDLIDHLGDRVQIHDPLDAMGKPIAK